MEDDQSAESQGKRIAPWQMTTLAVGVLLGVLIGFGYGAGWEFLGVAKNPEYQTVWDWLDLLIVPSAVAVGVFLIDRSQREHEQRMADARRQRELEIENQRAMDAALQAYLDQMSHLLLEKDLRNSEQDEVRMLARARTLTVLARLDPDRKSSVLRFLYETSLIDKSGPVIKLSGVSILSSISGAADLSGLDLAFVYMADVDLSGTLITGARLSFCQLPGADLREADLSDSDLSNTDLSGADLRLTVLSKANFAEAILEDANMQGVHLWDNDLTGANLTNANLREADFAGSITGPILSGDPDEDFGDAILTDADLSGADLTDATITEEQIAQCASLEGATMPGGQKYEDWLIDQ